MILKEQQNPKAKVTIMCALLLRCEWRYIFLKHRHFLVKALHCKISNSRKCLKQVGKIGELSSIYFTFCMFLCKPLQAFVIFISKTVDVFFILQPAWNASLRPYFGEAFLFSHLEYGKYSAFLKKTQGINILSRTSSCWDICNLFRNFHLLFCISVAFTETKRLSFKAWNFGEPSGTALMSTMKKEHGFLYSTI